MYIQKIQLDKKLYFTVVHVLLGRKSTKNLKDKLSPLSFCWSHLKLQICFHIVTSRSIILSPFYSTLFPHLSHKNICPLSNGYIAKTNSHLNHRYYIAYGLGLDTASRERIATIHYRMRTPCCA